jgi:F420-non-reducing hydrogenase large subunit
MRKISIDPVTRLEGHARIDLFLDDAGNVGSCYLIVPEIRGFEKFLEGRPVEELARITPRICGVCPEAHHAASAKAIENLYGTTIPAAAETIRRLQYNAFVAGDHATHFFALGGPDFIVGPDAPVAERNLIGVIRKVGLALGGQVIRMRKEAHEVARLLGGRSLDPVGMVPGGQSKIVTPEMRTRLLEIGGYMVEFSQLAQTIFADVVLANDAYRAMMLSEAFSNRTHYMALVDDDGHVDHYDGMLRVVNPAGEQVHLFPASRYLDFVTERVESWTYLKFPYLTERGWLGFVDGPESGLYRVGPLGMLNAAKGMKTPLAQAEHDKLFDTLGGKPVHATLAFHWARLVEMLQCSELVLQHASAPELTDTHIRVIPTSTPKTGIGVVEAPRGILVHHYETDEAGIVKRANLVVGTTNNHGPIQLSVKKAAASLLDGGQEPTEGVLNRIEMALRAYDPCFGCATHAFPGHMPMFVRVHDPNGNLRQTIDRQESGDTCVREEGKS